MKNILYIAAIKLKDPKRGTPIRILNLLKQIQRGHNLYISTIDIDDDLTDKYIPFANGLLHKLNTYRKIIKEKNIDVVVTSCESSIKLPVLLKILTGVKIAIDLHGLLSAELLYNNSINKLQSWLLQSKINFFLFFYNHLFVVSGKLGRFYSKINKKSTPIYGGVNIDEFPAIFNGRADTLKIAYTGNYRAYQGLDNLLTALSEIMNENLFPFHLTLILSNEDPKLLEQINKLNLNQFIKISYDVKHKEVSSYLSETNLLVIPRPSIDVTEYAYPTKLPEYLATEIPVLTTKVGPIEELFGDKNEYCLCIDPLTMPNSIKTALIEYNKLDIQKKIDIGKNAREFVMNNLIWTRIGDALNSKLENL